MSAIFGILNLDKTPVISSHMQKMQTVINHYGRDARDILIDKNIGLGCLLNRFSGNTSMDEPIYTDVSGNYTIIGDAEIYNREELIGFYQLSDNNQISTQALVLAAYKKWGIIFPKYINGDFVFVIWDKKKNQLLIARDHLGIRPIFYFYNNSTFAFATDFRALLSLPFVSKDLDEKYLFVNLQKICHFDPELTYFANIKELPQSNILQVDDKGLKKNKYWTPGKNGKIRFKTEQEYKDALFSLVSNAVSIRIKNTDRNIASELSGGLDSSVITILANKELLKKGKKIESFSWSPSFDYMEKKENDERLLLEQVCQRENISCTYYDPSIPLINKNEILPPDGVDAPVMRQEREILAARNVTYVLSGWGGDQAISCRYSWSFHAS